MKKVLAQGTKYLFGAFGIAILGLLMSLTYQALGRIFPTSPINQMWGLVLFDIAAITWALAFVFSCETIGQYAVAIFGFLTGFIGTLIMVAAEVMLGQTLTTTNSTEVGRWLIYGFIGATILHAILLYAHHYNGQTIRQKVEIGIARGEVTTEAIKQAQVMLDVEKANLARTIADGIIADTKRELGLYPIDGTPFDRRQQPREFNYSTEEILNEVKDISSILPSPTGTILHRKNILWDRGDDPAAYYNPDSPQALACGHDAGTTWNQTRKADECNICGHLLPPHNSTPTQEAGDQPSPFLKSQPE